MDSYILSNLFLVAGLIVTILAQFFVSSTYNKYKKIENSKKLSGFEVAKKLLDNNGLKEVYVTEVKGNLTDHYDPVRKVVRLSTDVFHGTSIASTAVAAHEVGHAIQDKQGYNFMKFRSNLFPLVKVSSYGGYFAILIGLLFNLIDLIWLGIVFELMVLLFQLVTLPVEFDASKRAKSELSKLKILSKSENESADKVLKSAAFTYVASVLTTILQILRLIVLIQGRRDD